MSANGGGVVLVALVEHESATAPPARFERSWRAPLAAGRALAAALERPLELLLVGPACCAEAVAVEVRALTGVSRTLCAESDVAPGSWPELVSAIARLARERGAKHVLLAHEYATIEQLPLLAALVEAAMISGAIGIERGPEGGVIWSRPVHQGKLIERLACAPEQPVVATIRAEGFGAGSGGPRELRPASDLRGPSTFAVEGCTLELAGRERLEGDGPRIEWLGDEEDGGSLDLTAADRIIAVGRGLGDPERLPPIRELARALGAELAGSRPVIDAGWLERERQVGSSGSTVSPELYLALGISGSAQHLAGMSTARCIVAINRDPEAPIFRVAHFGVVGDLHELVRELLRVLDAPGPTAGVRSS